MRFYGVSRITLEMIMKIRIFDNNSHRKNMFFDKNVFVVIETCSERDMIFHTFSSTLHLKPSINFTGNFMLILVYIDD